MEYILIGFYIIIILVISFYGSKNQTSSEYLIANRELGLFQFTGTVVASIFGGTTLVIYSALIYEFGIVAIFGLLSLGIGLITFGFLGKYIRKLAKEKELLTMADFFHHYYGQKVGNIASLLFVIIASLVILKQFIAGTQIFSTVSGWSYEFSLAFNCIIILIYIFIGGFRSVVKTDIFQYALIVFLLFVIGFIAQKEANFKFSEIQLTSFKPSLFFSFFIFGILFVWQAIDVWQRVYAAKNDRVVILGLTFSSIILLIIGLGIALIILSTKKVYPNLDPSNAISYGLVYLIPSSLKGLGIILLFSAIMSTADTFCFILASNLAKDIYPKFTKKDLTQKDIMKASKMFLFVVIILEGFFAYFFRDLIEIAFINVGLGMIMVPIAILTKFIKFNKTAVLLSIYSGLFYIVFCFLFKKVQPESMVFTSVVSGFILISSNIMIHKKRDDEP